jgi:glycosyltransferase involved in cell wall biosynthesis
MKVVLAVHHFPPTYSGGAELRAYRTASALQSRGYDLRVICVERVDVSPPGGEGLTWEDGIYEGIPVRRLFFDRDQAPDPSRWEYDNPWVGEHVYQFLEQESPQIFHLISGYLLTGSALQAAMRLDIPTVVTLTDFWFLCPRTTMLRSNGELSTLPLDAVTCARCVAEEQRRYATLSKFSPPALAEFYWKGQKDRIGRAQARMDFLKDILQQVDVIISPSRFMQSMFVQSGFGRDQIVFSRQGRDFPGLSTGLSKKTSSDSLRVGYLGQIISIKGVHVLFEAVRRLAGVPIEVNAYGDLTIYPEYTQRLQKMAAQDHRLSLKGKYPNSELSRVFSEIDVIVVPSEWYENSPNVILEAFAHRTPVIASNLGGMAELVQDGVNGLLFEAGNPDSLAIQLKRLIEDPFLLPTLCEGINPVRSVHDEMNELEDIYREVLEKRVPTEEILWK